MPIRRGLAIHEQESVGNAIQLIREAGGYFQEADFLDRQLEINHINEAKCYEFRSDEVNDKGQLVDRWGHPYVYIHPGKFYKSEFDLCSVGPNGVDEGGKSGDDVFCYLGRA
jgi:hypothetical protein